MKKLFLLLFLLITVPGWGATYYIDFASGADTNNGTAKGTPWKRAPGMTGFAATYVHAAGDQFIFKGGVTWDSTVFNWAISNSGSSGNVDYYGVDATWYDGGSWTQPILNGGAWGGVPAANRIYVTGSYIKIDNLLITNIGVAYSVPSSQDRAITLANNSNIEIVNCVLTPYARIGIYVYNSTASTTRSNFTIHNNDISCVSWGIAFGTSAANAVISAVSIHDNLIHDFTTQMCGGDVHGDGIIIYSGGVGTGNVSSVDIYNNKFYGDFHTNTSQTACAAVCASGKYCSMNAWIFVQNAEGSTYNIYNNAAYPTNVLGWYNGSTQDMNSNFNLQSTAGSNTFNIYNNSLSVDSHVMHGFQFTNLTTINFKNNIVVGSAYPLLPTDVGSCNAFIAGADYNQYYGWTATFAGFPSGCGGFQNWTKYHVTNAHETNSLNSNPQFFSSTDLHLTASSPGKSAGTNLSTSFTIDLDGVTRPSAPTAWAMGAYEPSHVTAPVISSISANVSAPFTAVITWTTDENATSVVDYGLSDKYGSSQTVTGYATSHSVAIAGLVASTLYHFKVTSADVYGNSSSSSDQTFTTGAGATDPGNIRSNKLKVRIKP